MRERMRRLASVAAVTVVGAGMLAACSSGPPKPDATVSAFLAGWKAHAFPASVVFEDSKGNAVANATVASQITALSGDLAKLPPTLTAAAAQVTKDNATDKISISWPITATTKWSYDTTMTLTLHNNKQWHVVWSPALVEPHLTAGDTIKIKAVAADRGAILDGSGQPMVTAQQVVTVGIQQSKVKDMNSLITALHNAFVSVHVDVDLSGVPDQVNKAGPNDFVTVVTLRNTVYQQIRSQIHDLPGTVFQSGTRQLAPTPVFAHALLGTVNDVTKEQMDKNPGKYHIGDQVGNGGIQQAYDDRLRGTPGLTIVIPGKSDAAGGFRPDNELFHIDAVAGQPVKTSIDVRIQNAADATLAHEPKPAAIIAMSISTGKILAVANGPGSPGFDIALEAQVPPGSTFKTVTATNVLESGKLTPQSIVNCPPLFTVQGRSFKNAESEQFGPVPLLTDFAKSCNTAFASLYDKLGHNGLSTTAAQLGIGAKWSVGVPTFTGSVPPDGEPVDQAAAAFGQGKTLVSPVAMIADVGTLARGNFIAPTVIDDPPVANNPGPGQPLKPTTVANMKTMMRAVVTSGTGVKCNGIPGGPVFGKTGTAEFDSNPADTHSWFIGYQGDVAFAVFVQNGGLSTAAAVPLAKIFLTSLQ